MVRPRSAEAHRKVLDAAAKLFAAAGMDATSMDAIAEASTVSKATIYKHWRDKDSLCLEVLSHLHGLDEERPVFDSGDFRHDLIAQLRYQPAAEHKTMKDKIWPHLIAYSARNPAFGKAWREMMMEPSRKGLISMIKQAEQRGILQMKGVSIETALAILLGPMLYRHIFIQRLGGKPPEDLEVHVADAFLGAFGAGSAGKRKRDRRPLRLTHPA